MNITVVTPFDSANYGAYLQAYCLKLQLESWGHNVNHLSTRSTEFVQGLYYSEHPQSKRDKLLIGSFFRKKAYGLEKYRLFCKDQEFFHVIDDLADDDLYILGSDEIWNVNRPSFRDGVFWGKGMKKVISYAASMGTASIEDIEKYPELVNLERRISSVLVRDQRTKELVQKIDPNKLVDVVCDPTMLVPVDTYGYQYKDPYLEKNACLLIYAYSLRQNEIEAIRRYAHEEGLKTVACCFYHPWCDHQCMSGPLGFSSIIRQCEAVITTTFHGSIFSILNHANFVSIPTSPKTNQLLEQLNLPGQLLEREKITKESIKSILSKKADYSQIEKEIAIMREASRDKLQSAIATAEEEKSFDYQICPSDDCCGCFACMNKCPKQAISIVTDKYGRTLPVIDPQICVHCGLCKKTCPILNPILLQKPKECIAAQRTDEMKRRNSSSGGVGAVLAEEYIHRGGVVYGAAVTKEAIVQHQRADTLAEIEAFRGSKYVQSYIGNSYQYVLEDLKKGRFVLFTGTPCQIAGLRNFLGKEYDNLCLVDIICHGVPPMRYLSEYISHVAPYSVISNFCFRGGERDFVLKLYSENKVVYEKYKDKDEYYTAFLNRLTYRENCYSCKYAACNRGSDITIGDFWKLDRESLVTPQEGRISVVLINTKKGKEAFDWIKNQLVYEQRAYDEAINGNPQLREAAKKHKDRSAFIDTYEKTGCFWEAIQNTSIQQEIVKYKYSKYLPYRIIRKIKNILS